MEPDQPILQHLHFKWLAVQEEPHPGGLSRSVVVQHQVLAMPIRMRVFGLT